MADQESKHELQKQETQLPEGVERTREGKTFLPATDIRESNDEIVLVADMPGVQPDKVDITLENQVLTVSGTASDQAPEGAGLMYGEYEVGDYRRAFTVSDEIDADGIEAQMQDGVLTLRLPKSAPTRKRIAVKAD